MAAESFKAFGEQLRSERLKQRRSLDDIASAIKIHRRHLESIEAGDLAALPQGPYVAAFVREYARSLNVPLPPEYAPRPGAPTPSPKDPKVVSHPAGESIQLSQVAKETARLANTAVKSAVKTVTKTTESVVNLVESGGKEALEVLTSKSLWEEAEDIRRERHGLPPIERKPEPAKEVVSEPEPEPETTPMFAEVSQRVERVRTSKKATNFFIILLALGFGVIAYYAIRTSRTGEVAANKEYVPAPLEKPQTMSTHKAEKAAVPEAAAVAPAIKDSLQFVMKATGPVWVSIAPDGIPAYRGEMKAGETKSFRAGTKFVVNIGNEKAVAMQFNGAPLSGLPTIQNSSIVVRDLVLMRDHVMLGGKPVDMHQLTSAPPPPQPKPTVVATPPPAVHPSTKNIAGSKSVTNIKKPTKPGTPTINKLPGQSPKPPYKPPFASTNKNAKGNSQSSSSKKPTSPVIHPVEPVPPSP